jgi:thymidylate kinase
VLIEIEGTRGSGKSTLIANLCAGAASEKPRSISAAAAEQQINDPGWLVGVFMRGLQEPIPTLESFFLYCARTAARARVISDLLAPDVAVFSDRLSLSLYVQARFAGITPTDAQLLVRLVLRGVEPDWTVLLDADYPTHHRRLRGQGREPQPEPEFQAGRAYFAQAYEAVTTARFCVDTTGMTMPAVHDAVLSKLPLPG